MSEFFIPFIASLIAGIVTAVLMKGDFKKIIREGKKHSNTEITVDL